MMPLSPARRKRLLIHGTAQLSLVLSVLALSASQAFAAWPPSHCTHVDVLEAGDDDEIIDYDGATLMDAADEQLEVLGTAIDLMPEVLCQAVRRVAFINRPPENEDDPPIDAWTNRNEHQDLVYLNTREDLAWDRDLIDRSPADRAKGIQRFIHESTHAAIRMIQSQQKAEPYRFRQDRADPDLWPASAQQLAKEVVKSNRLETGVIREWQRMHDAFVAAGMSSEYRGNDWPKLDNLTSEQLTSAGFTSAYGGEQAIEDIAEMTSWAIVRGAAEDPEDAACRIMNRRSGTSISRDDAAIFTKLGFVRTLGFISEQTYKSCVGSLEIETPGEGFFSFTSGDLSTSYDGDPRASAGRGDGDDEQWLFVNIESEGILETTGGPVPVTVFLQLNTTPPVDAITDPGKRADRLAIPTGDFSYPRGVYMVGFRHSKHNRLLFKRRWDSAIIVDVGEGVALVGRASSEGIIGSIAVQRVFNFSGGMLSAIAGDEPVNEPTKITFKYVPR